MENTKLSEPNELGFQFMLNSELTKLAYEKQHNWNDRIMPSVDINVLEVYKEGKKIAYLLVDEKTSIPIKETYSLESCAVAIEAIKLRKLKGENND